MEECIPFYPQDTVSFGVLLNVTQTAGLNATLILLILRSAEIPLNSHQHFFHLRKSNKKAKPKSQAEADGRSRGKCAENQ